jgi:hypothetical protein
VFTVLPHFVLRYRSMRPEVARDALLATHGGLSLELCAVLYHLSPMALYRLVWALGPQGMVTVLTRCGLALPVYCLADEKRAHCPTTKVSLPTIVRGRVLGTSSVCCRSIGVLHLSHFLNQEDLREREAMFQNP